jgi:serine-type D-Ala-D-Ala carboxypeptidase/endopeptidase (penicillin-binding protein 4)
MLLSSCFFTTSIGAQKINKILDVLVTDSVVKTGHIGISIFEPATNKYWYNYNADKYFVPASNVKLFTCYAAMKFLGDSLPGLYYQLFSDSTINIWGAGDPSFLHPIFTKQPILQFLQQPKKSFYLKPATNSEALGQGWSWDDYNEDFMAERNDLPMYGNVMQLTYKGIKNRYNYAAEQHIDFEPTYFNSNIDSLFLLPLQNRKFNHEDTTETKKLLSYFDVVRQKESNQLHYIFKDSTAFTKKAIPFYTAGNNTAIEILKNQWQINIQPGQLHDNGLYPNIPPHLQWHTLYSQPTDSVLRYMMVNSDNFMAEQILVMLQQKSHFALQPKKSIQAVINDIITQALDSLPQKSTWVDGSGLSRYNLFTPQSMVYILNKIKNEFGIDRLKAVLPTTGQGTLQNYYIQDSTFIFAKTGTLTGCVALSGILITKKNKTLVFSILTNNFNGKPKAVRRAIEKALQALRNNF